MDRLPIEIKLKERKLLQSLFLELAPHVVIVASGHGDTPKFPKNVEGLDNEIVCTTMDLLNGKAPKIAWFSVEVLWAVISPSILRAPGKK